MQVEPGAFRATCPFCGLSSPVGPAAPSPAPWGPPVPFAPSRSSSGAGCAIASIAGGLVALIALGAGVAMFSFRSRAVSVPVATPPAITAPVPTVSPIPVPAGVATIAIVAPDLHHVDLVELIRQAQVVALRTDSHAHLTSAQANELVDGLVDATGENTADVEFEYKYNDPSKPPGRDQVAGSVTLAVYAGAFRSSTMPAAMGESIDDPRCASKSAWQTAVKSGVPANAAASLLLYKEGFGAHAPIVWSVRVSGHDEYRREIDSKSCALLKSWAR
jgi:hypothetical protein